MLRLYWKKLAPPRRFNFPASGNAVSIPTPKVEIFSPIPTFEEPTCPGPSDGGSAPFGRALPAFSSVEASVWSSAWSVDWGMTPGAAGSLRNATATAAFSTFGAPARPDPAKQCPLHPVVKNSVAVATQSTVLVLMYSPMYDL